MDKLFYTITEVAAILGEQVSLVRYWSNKFPGLVKPVRNAHGNRSYTAKDVEMLRTLHYLVKEKGLTLEGARKELSARRSEIETHMKIADSLKALRRQLVEIRDSL